MIILSHKFTTVNELIQLKKYLLGRLSGFRVQKQRVTTGSYSTQLSPAMFKHSILAGEQINTWSVKSGVNREWVGAT